MSTYKVLIGVTAVIIVAAVAIVLLPGKSVAPTTPTSSLASIPDLIEVSAPTQSALVLSPLVVTGRARGTWYFEASFPIELKDQSGNTIATGHGQAQGNWMTEDFVPFASVPLMFAAQPAGSAGTLVLYKDNPSGDPARDQSLSVPVVF